MHIRENEATDSIDWEYFYKGQNAEFPIWAHKLWALLHDAMDNIPCSMCRQNGIDLMRAFHDLKNYELGHPLFDRENFLKMAKLYTDAAAHVSSEIEIPLTVHE